MFFYWWWQLALCASLILFLPQVGQTHGVEGFTEKGGLVVVARYAGGDTMSHAKVTITSPGSEKPFQTGRTDHNGKFAFVPDVPGNWRFMADDEMGHRLIMMVEVDEASLAGRAGPKSQAAAGSKDMTARGFFGVAFLMLAASIILWWQAKKLEKKRLS